MLIQVLGVAENVFLFLNDPVYPTTSRNYLEKYNKFKKWPDDDDAPTKQNSLLFETTSDIDEWNEISVEKLFKN